ncbi:MAG: glycosyltransferase family 4 protein [Ardenticatenaceae bacterium]
MRICMLVQEYYNIDARVRRESEALVKAGHQVDVIALRDKRTGPVEYCLNGVNVRTVFLPKKQAGILRYVYEYLTFMVVAFWYLNVQDRQHHYDLVQANTLPDFLVFSAIIQKLKGTTILLDMHEIAPEFFQSKFNQPASSWSVRIVSLAERLSIRFADYVLTVNDSIKDVLVGRGVPPDKIDVIMNSADPQLFSPNGSTPKDAKQDADLTLMYHGTLTHIYGLDIAVRALPLIREKLPSAKLIIIGDGPARANLEALAEELQVKEYVHFVGRIPQEQILARMYECNFGVLPTRQDVFLDLSFSNKLAEYIAVGKPVVATALTTTQRYFSDKSITYVPSEDYAELARKIVALYNNPQRQIAQVSQAWEEYAAIDWNVMKKRYVELVESL